MRAMFAKSKKRLQIDSKGCGCLTLRRSGHSEVSRGGVDCGLIMKSCCKEKNKIITEKKTMSCYLFVATSDKSVPSALAKRNNY